MSVSDKDGQMGLDERQHQCLTIARRLISSTVSFELERRGIVDLPDCLRTQGEASQSSASTSASSTATANSRTETLRGSEAAEVEKSESNGGVNSAREQSRTVPGSRGSNVFLILSYVTKIVKKKYLRLFKVMIEELKPSQATAYQQFVGVSSGLFENEVTYGKIVGLFVFCNELITYCMEKPEMGQAFVPSVLSWFTHFYRERLAGWMAEHDGWVGFEKFYSNFVSQIGTVDASGQIIPFSESHPQNKENGAFLLSMGSAALATLAIGYFISQ